MYGIIIIFWLAHYWDIYLHLLTLEEKSFKQTHKKQGSVNKNNKTKRETQQQVYDFRLTLSPTHGW